MSDILKSDQPGAFVFWTSPGGMKYFIANCPCGCNVELMLPVRRRKEPYSAFRAVWIQSGTDECPTLAPSIRRNTPCQFHGHLRYGVWTHATEELIVSPVARACYRAPAAAIHKSDCRLFAGDDTCSCGIKMGRLE